MWVGRSRRFALPSLIVGDEAPCVRATRRAVAERQRTRATLIRRRLGNSFDVTRRWLEPCAVRLGSRDAVRPVPGRGAAAAQQWHIQRIPSCNSRRVSRKHEQRTIIAMEASLARGFEDGIFWITERIAIGRFATVERSRRLLELGVTHILNVGDTPSLAEVATAGFQSVAEVPLEDLTLIPCEAALRCLDLMHEVLSVPDSKLFVHCTAGQNRSPTVIWLYLVACGTP